MKAFLYADWCIIRSTLLRVLGVSVLISVPITLASVGDVEMAPAVFVAVMLVMMLSFYLMLYVFSADEQDGWEQARLAFPATVSTFVRSRYTLIAIVACASAVLGTVCGLVVQAVFSATSSLTVPRSASTVAISAFGAVFAVLAYLSILLPLVFHLGIHKARVWISVPFLSLSMLAYLPVQGTLDGIERYFVDLAARLGTPVPLFAAAALLAVLFYLLSMHLSMRIYAAREL